MDARTKETATASRSETAESLRRIDRWLAASLGALAVVLAANSVVGPLLADAVSYPFSATMVNQTIGLEAVTLAVVVPWCVAAAVLLVRGHRAAPFLAVPPSAYAAYMFVQYVVGPRYLTYRPIVAFHLGIFVLSGVVLAATWWRIQHASLPAWSPRRERNAALGLFALGAFTTFRYVPVFAGMAAGDALTAEFAADPSMFWAIFFLDLGVVVPVSFGVGLGLLRGTGWARRAVYGVAGWYVLVPVSVVAMGTAMVLNNDPHATAGTVGFLSVAAVAFTVFAVWVFRPLFGRADGAAGSP